MVPNQPSKIETPPPETTEIPAEAKEEVTTGIQKILFKTGKTVEKIWVRVVPTIQKVSEFLGNLPETINETQTRRVGIHNIVLVIFCFTAFVLSFLVLSQDIEEVYDDQSEINYPMEISPFYELMDGYAVQYNKWYLNKIKGDASGEDVKIATTTEAN